MGFRIFSLCLRQLYINWLVAVRLSWFWIVIMLLAVGLMAVVSGNMMVAATSGESVGGAGLMLFLVGLGLFLVFLIAFATIAIGWHRWVLRDDEPDRFYVLRSDWSIGAYILRSLLIGLITLLIIGPVYFTFMLTFAGNIVGADGTPQITSGFLARLLVVSVIVGTIGTWIVLRIGLILPAIAVGERMTIGESFRETSKIAGPLVVTALCVVLFQSIPSILDMAATSIIGNNTVLETIATIVNLIFSWISFFISFGILTVVYGHVVEDRPI